MRYVCMFVPIVHMCIIDDGSFLRSNFKHILTHSLSLSFHFSSLALLFTFSLSPFTFLFDLFVCFFFCLHAYLLAFACCFAVINNNSNNISILRFYFFFHFFHIFLLLLFLFTQLRVNVFSTILMYLFRYWYFLCAIHAHHLPAH